MGREGGPSPKEMGVEPEETRDNTLKEMADKRGIRGSGVKKGFKERLAEKARVDNKPAETESEVKE